MFEDVYFLLNASKTCFGVAVAFLILAVVLFFLFDIRKILTIETGSGRRKTVQEMHDRNLRTGKLRVDPGASSEGGSTREQKNKTSGKSTQRHNTVSNKTESTAKGRLSRKGGTQKFEDSQGVSNGTKDCQKSADTVFLSDNSPKTGLRFSVIQKTIVIHTDEIIPF